MGSSCTQYVCPQACGTTFQRKDKNKDSINNDLTDGHISTQERENK